MAGDVTSRRSSQIEQTLRGGFADLCRSVFGDPLRPRHAQRAAASRSSSKWQNEPKFNFKQLPICFSRKPCRFRDPVALAFVWRMPDARSVRASATWGGR
jgi:hypothetical protein